MFGTVQTAGDMVLPVTRARVYVMRGGDLLGETFTDSEGQFVWCMPTADVGDGIDASLFVEKPPFVPTGKDGRLVPGRHIRLHFALEAPGLTDG